MSKKIRMPKKAFLILLMPVILAWPALARDWYIDNAATGRNDGKSWVDAWQSFADIGALQPGDAVYISGGTGSKTYREQLLIYPSGTSTAPITFDIGANSPHPAGHNGQVRIDGGEIRSFCSRVYGDYVTVKNMYCEDAIYDGFRSGAKGVVFEGNTIHSVYSRGIHFNACTDCIARGNKITTDDDLPKQTDGITSYGSTRTIVEHNWIYISNQNDCDECHHDGIQSSMDTDFTARYNYVENIKQARGNAQGIFVTAMKGTTKFIGNVVILPYGPQALANGFGESRSIMIGNTVKCGGYRCLIMDDPDPILMNNLVWQTKNGDLITLVDWKGDPANIDYNLWYAPNARYGAFGFGSKSFKWKYWTDTLGFDKHGINNDPSLDSCLRPSSGSAPSVGAGAVLASEFASTLSGCWQNADDFLQASPSSRGNSWDIGAYQYGDICRVLIDSPQSSMLLR
jgi:hypothetical protein